MEIRVLRYFLTVVREDHRGNTRLQWCIDKKFIRFLDFSGFWDYYVLHQNLEKHVMEHLDIEVQYRAAKWLFINTLFEGEVTLEEYTAMHKLLIDKLNPLLKSVETLRFYIQESSMSRVIKIGAVAGMPKQDTVPKVRRVAACVRVSMNFAE